jgi:hypothetical protein
MKLDAGFPGDHELAEGARPKSVEHAIGAHEVNHA